MSYYARIVFEMDDSYEFIGVTETPTIVFSKGNLQCTIKREPKLGEGNRSIPYIVEIGPFVSGEMANNVGLELLRDIKLNMVKSEFPINITGSPGKYDTTSICTTISAITDAGKQTFLPHVDPSRIENDYIGLKIFQVKTDLSELTFFKSSVSAKSSANFSLSYPLEKVWTDRLDISLSLLNSSIHEHDIRIQFLLRIMAIEALVPSSDKYGPEYIEAKKKAIKQIETLNIDPEITSRFRTALDNSVNKSIRVRVNCLLKKHLSDKRYGASDSDAISIFSACYKARSSFTHDGTFPSGFKLVENSRSLKLIALDLISSISLD
ncbi:unknown [Clostridium sp. CAG:1013]|nr:unknown [Clostridium sp. CAG:1013]